MTIYSTLYESCSVCGFKSKQKFLKSHKKHGNTTLGLRPNTLNHDHLKALIHFCPICNFANYRISRNIQNAKEIIETTEYLDQLKNPAFSEEVNLMLSNAIIHKKNNNLNVEFWLNTLAGWLCDDEDNLNGSYKCYADAIEIYFRAMDNEIQFKNKTGEILLIADVMRRARKFQDAKDYINNLHQIVKENFYHNILKYQFELCEKEDDNIHFVKEVFSEYNIPLFFRFRNIFKQFEISPVYYS
jgi:hypothetical protein